MAMRTVRTDRIGYCLTVAIAVMKHHDQDQKQDGEGRVIWLILPRCSPLLKEVRKGTQGKNLEAGANVKMSRRGVAY